MPIADERSEVPSRATENRLENPFPLKGKNGNVSSKDPGSVPWLARVSPGLRAVMPEHKHFAGLGKEDFVSLPAASLWEECSFTDVGNAGAACKLPLPVLLQ